MNPPKVVAAIPARWGSSRFPGKPLAQLRGKPLIVHVVERAREARCVDLVLVATDHTGVFEAARSAGAIGVMTGAHPSGTDRIAEAVRRVEGWEIVLNVQGDEPLLPPENIDRLVETMLESPGVGMATLCRPLDPERAGDPNVVKVVRRRDGRALYFSRSTVPFGRNEEAAGALLRAHLGIYGYRREALERFVALPPSPLERAEGLEQLRALENGMEIVVLDAPHDSLGIDTPEDLEEAERRLAGAEGST
ncbi:MAG: 3-deoxy-manno-octulosonate cytidylyltransferase [Acidobacteria bacterium]|nr:3-deoxy-manno-octulosonate cytidylyltransferase [Acidobacteriota bacterium]